MLGCDRQADRSNPTNFCCVTASPRNFSHNESKTPVFYFHESTGARSVQGLKSMRSEQHWHPKKLGAEMLAELRVKLSALGFDKAAFEECQVGPDFEVMYDGTVVCRWSRKDATLVLSATDQHHGEATTIRQAVSMTKDLLTNLLRKESKLPAGVFRL
jgi:hypothetical protein